MNIAVCSELSFDYRGAYKHRGDKNRQFREAFLLLNSRAIKDVGHALYFVRLDDIQEDGVFNRYYLLDEGRVSDGLRFTTVNKKIMPDVVLNRRKDELYNHRHFANASWAAYNDPGIASLGDKAVCLDRFSRYMPRSIYVDGYTDAINDAIKEKNGLTTWVVKPLRRNGGKGIRLLDRNETLSAVASNGDRLLLQQFCEARSVPELEIVGRHDVRVYVVDGKPLFLAIRQPREGGFLANTAAGGSIRFADIGRLPSDAASMMNDILEDINKISKRYFISIDMFYTDDGWRLIEINDQPGIPAAYQTPAAEHLTQMLINSLKGAVYD